MNETSLSLIQQLRRSPEDEAWERLHCIYQPLIEAWLKKYGVQQSDAADLIQEVLLTVSKDLRNFEHVGRPGAFRAWLKGILINRLRNFWRARDRHAVLVDGSILQDRLNDLGDPQSQLSLLWNKEHDQYVLRQLLMLVEPQVTPQTWIAFYKVALEGQSPRDVAAELEISLNAVVIAKSRVLNRLRLEAAGIIESSSNFPVDP